MLDFAQLKTLSSALTRIRKAVRNSSNHLRWGANTPSSQALRADFNDRPSSRISTKLTNKSKRLVTAVEKNKEVFFRRNESDYIQHKVALVTGGTEGIGLRCVRELLKNGARGVMIADREADGLQCVKMFARDFGGDRVAFIRIDNSQELLRHAFTSTLHHFHGLDIVINSLKFREEKGWTEQIDENVKGVVMNTLLALEFMGRHRGRNGGTVVNIAQCFDDRCDSCPVFQGVQEFLVGFDRSLAADNYPNSDVKVLTICQATMESVGIDLATVIAKGRNGCVWTP